jgi:hypothetical protein
MPMSLAGEQSYQPEGLSLSWLPGAETDLLRYHVYRGLGESFVPGPGNRIAATSDTTAFDGDWRWDTGYYYKVSAVDIHGNESGFAVLGPTDVTGDETAAVPAANRLHQNFPNPFNPTTVIAFDLKEPAFVRLRVYDAAGRLVRTLLHRRLDPSRHEVPWNGTDDAGAPVSSGVYFYRIEAGGFTETRKMLLLR